MSDHRHPADQPPWPMSGRTYRVENGPTESQRIAELEQALAHERGLREVAELALEQVRARSKLEIKRQVTEREAAEAELAAQEQVSREMGRSNWTKDQWRQLAGLAKGSRNRFEQDAADLRDYATRLLAALTQQRQALENIMTFMGRNADDMADHKVWRRGWDALATDHAALLAEGATLGVGVQP